MPRTLLGRWVGGPYDNTVIIELGPQGVQGRFKCASGAWGTFEGLFIGGGTRVKGTYRDPDAQHSGTETDQTLDMRLNSDGVSWTANVTLNGASASSWSGRKRKWQPTSQKAWYRNKECWDRLTKPTLSSSPEWVESQRKQVLAESYDERKRRRKNGLLCESAPLNSGAEYNDQKKTAHSRHRGRSFVSGTSKFTRTHGLFSMPQPLAVGAPYEDATARRRRALLAQRAKDRKFERPIFKPTGAKETRASDPGFLSAVTKDTDPATLRELLDNVEASKKRPTVREVELQPKNFLTNPPRKGHYAQPGALLGHKTADGAALFQYKADPYDRRMKAERAAAAALRKKLEEQDKKPFVSQGSRASRAFNKDSEVYKGVAPGGPAPRTRTRPQSAPAHRAGGSEEERPRWVPNNPAKRGGVDGAFNRPPKYMPEPLPAPAMRVRDDESDAKWLPNPTGSTLRPVVPVMTSKVNLRRIMYPGRPSRGRSSASRPASAAPLRI